MTEDSEMIRYMIKNYKLLRTIHHDFYTTIAENFQYYLGTLTQHDFNEIDADIVASSLNSLQNVVPATELLMLFDFFDFVHGRFPTTPTHTFVPRADLPMEVNGEELNIKKLYEKFRTANSHALVSSRFLAALSISFGGDPELSHRFLTEFTDLSISINSLLRSQRNQNISEIKAEDDNTDSNLKTKYDFDDDDYNNPPPPPYPIETIQDNLNTEPENIDEKAKQVDIVEPKLETPAEIEESDKTKKAGKSWLDEFLAGVENTKHTLQELNDQAIAAVLSEEANTPKIDTEIDPVFIGDNDDFCKDILTDENKAFMKTLLYKRNYKDILGDIEDKDNQQKLIQGDQSVPILPQAQPQPQPTTTLNIPDLRSPKPTGIKRVDDNYWDDYIKLLEIYAPHMIVDKPDIIDGSIVPTIKPEIVEIDDVVPTEPWLRPKTEEEIVEIDDVVPTEPWLSPEPIPVISQETVKLPR